MHSSDLVATANFTGHSTGTAQHLLPLPTCMRAREREKHIDNIVQVSCEGSQLQRLMPPPLPPYKPFIFEIYEIAALRQCCEVNYGLRAYKNADYSIYANLKI